MTGNDPEVAQAVAFLRTLANPARLRIVLHLLDGEQPVGQIETALGLKQPNLSQHLGELRDAGMVVARRDSRSMVYRLAEGRAEALAQAVRQGLGGAPAPATPAARWRPAYPIAAARFATVEPGP